MRKRIFSCTIHYIPVRIVIRFTLSALEAGYFSSPEQCISIAAAVARPAVARDLSGSVRMCPVFLGKPCPVLSGPAGNFAPECRHDIAAQSRCQPAALGFSSPQCARLILNNPIALRPFLSSSSTWSSSLMYRRSACSCTMPSPKATRARALASISWCFHHLVGMDELHLVCHQV